MKNRSKVTALVPAYQSAKFIQNTLDSLSLQTQDDFKVIISVDLCEDETYDICRQHAAKDPRFQVFKQNKQLGYVGNCNFLLDLADSEYVLFAFHDDILDARYAEKLCAVLDKHPKVIMAYSDILITTFEGKTKNFNFRKLDGVESSVKRGLIMLRRKGKWFIPNRGIFRLDEARKIQGLKLHAGGDFGADWPWLFHMSLLGQFQSIPEILCHKYYKENSLSRSWAGSKEEWYNATAAGIREIKISPLSFFEKTRLITGLLLQLFKLKFSIKKRALKSLFK